MAIESPPVEDGDKPTESKSDKKSETKSTFHQLIPQIIACCIKNYTIFTAGVSSQFPTIIIPALTGINNEEEDLSITSDESSWFGSLIGISQLIGSLCAGYLVDGIGRKRVLLVTSFPPIIALLMFYFSNSILVIFAAYILIGINNGIVQVACVTYTGEVCQVNIRAIMVCTATISYTAGTLILYTLGSMINWRIVALSCLVFPISSFIFVLVIPESPIWLLSNKREDESRKSLQWLRGWVSADKVEEEFQSMRMSFALDTQSNPVDENRFAKFKETLKNFISRRTLVPFLITILLLMVSMSNGFFAMTPFLVQIFTALGSNINAYWCAVIAASLSLMGTVCCAVSIKFLGKRKICLMGLVMCAICTAVLGAYAFKQLPSGWNSFEIPDDVRIESSWTPLICIVGLFFFTSFSVADVPWMYMTELFPFKTRGFASGLSVTVSLLIGFINTKAYKDLEIELSIGGAMFFFAGLTVAFIPLLYLFLPETEGITIDEIDKFFSSKNRKMTDVNIRTFLRSQSQTKVISESSVK